MTTAGKFSPKTSPTPSDTPTCEQLALELSPGLTLSAADSPAKIFPMPESAWALRDHEADYGANITESFASYDRDSLSWKTSQLCLDGELSEFWETWPRAGMTRNGIAFQRAPLAPLTGRDRVWIVAYPASDLRGASGDGGQETPNGSDSLLAHAECSERWPLSEKRNESNGNNAGREKTASGFTQCREDVADADSRRFAMQREPSGGSGLTTCGGKDVADTHGAGCEEQRRPVAVSPEQYPPECRSENVADTHGGRREQRDAGERRIAIFNAGSYASGADWWAVEPDVGRVAHGVSKRVDRLKGLGNAIIPQIAEFIGRRIIETCQK